MLVFDAAEFVEGPKERRDLVRNRKMLGRKARHPVLKTDEIILEKTDRVVAYCAGAVREKNAVSLVDFVPVDMSVEHVANAKRPQQFQEPFSSPHPHRIRFDASPQGTVG